MKTIPKAHLDLINERFTLISSNHSNTLKVVAVNYNKGITCVDATDPTIKRLCIDRELSIKKGMPKSTYQKLFRVIVKGIKSGYLSVRSLDMVAGYNVDGDQAQLSCPFS